MNETDLLERLSLDADLFRRRWGCMTVVWRRNDRVVFIAERFSGWEIMERWELSQVRKIETSESL